MVATIKPMFPGFCSSAMMRIAPTSRTEAEVSNVSVYEGVLARDIVNVPIEKGTGGYQAMRGLFGQLATKR